MMVQEAARNISDNKDYLYRKQIYLRHLIKKVNWNQCMIAEIKQKNQFDYMDLTIYA